jgi:hypothetical protein
LLPRISVSVSAQDPCRIAAAGHLTEAVVEFYEPMDDPGNWRLALAQEMLSAGLAVDLNKIFRRG